MEKNQLLCRILEFWKYFDALDRRPILTLQKPDGTEEKDYITTRRLEYLAGIAPRHPLDFPILSKPIISFDLDSLFEEANLLKSRSKKNFQNKVPLVHLYLGVYYEKHFAQYLVKHLSLNLKDSDLFDVDSKPMWLYTARLILVGKDHICGNLQEVKLKEESPPVLTGTFFNLPTFWIYFQNLFLLDNKDKTNLTCDKVLSELGLTHLRFNQEVAKFSALPWISSTKKTIYLIIQETKDLLEETGSLNFNNPWFVLIQDIFDSADLKVIVCPSEGSIQQTNYRLEQGKTWLQEFLNSLPSKQTVQRQAHTVFSWLQTEKISPDQVILIGFDHDKVPEKYRHQVFRTFPLIVTTLSPDKQEDLKRILTWFNGRLKIVDVFDSSYARVIPFEDQEPPGDIYTKKMLSEARGKAFWPWLFNLEFVDPDRVEAKIKEILNTDLPSFFVEEIENIEKQLAKNVELLEIERYIFGKKEQQKLEDVYTSIFDFENLPGGKWASPKGHKAFTNQQAAIFLTCKDYIQGRDSCPLISVNGPPGSGKTTLLRDIIAALVVERARLLLKYKWENFRKRQTSPSLLFSKVSTETEDEEKTMLKWHFTPEVLKILLRTSIVVVSANNKAVENVSKELPRQDSLDLENAEEEIRDFVRSIKFFDLFRDLGTKYLQEPAWGLISAVLGKYDNNRNFSDYLVNILFPTIQKLSEFRSKEVQEQYPEIAQAADSLWYGLNFFEYFHNKQKNVLKNLQDTEKSVQKIIRHMPLTIEDIRKVFDSSIVSKLYQILQKECLLEKLKDYINEYINIENNLTKKIEQYERLVDKCHLIESRFYRIKEYIKYVLKIRKDRPVIDHEDPVVLTAELTRIAEDKVELERKAEVIKNHLERIWSNISGSSTEQCTDVRLLEKKATKIAAELQEEKEKIKQFILEQFSCGTDQHYILSPEELEILIRSLSPLKNHEDDQQRTPFGINSFEVLRKLSFLSAILVNWFFIRENWRQIRKALDLWRKLVLGKIKDDNISTRDILTSWAALFFITPVISTTYHSVRSLFRYLGHNSLGLIISDESGQAAPYMALGVLYRGQGFIAVGDPLQLEPVVTVPKWLREILDHKTQLSKSVENAGLYRPGTSEALRVQRTVKLDTSVQVLADRAASVFDEVILEEGYPFYVGIPLWVHFRCSSPMFDIANRIAYGNRMVHAAWKRKEPGRAIWLNIKDQNMSGNVSTKEILTAFNIISGAKRPEIIQQLLEQIGFNGKDPINPKDVYVITPFRDIYSLRRDIIISGQKRKEEEILRFIRTCSRWNLKWRKWLKEHTGTVHTFQGKEAPLVILCLGGQTPGARRWVVSKPNLINVAVTRAKRGLIILGNYEAWRETKPEWFDPEEGLLKDLIEIV